MKFAKRSCPVLCAFKTNGQATIILCGRWNCPVCAKKLAKQWARRVYLHLELRGVETGELWYFLTLTLGSGYKDPGRAFGQLRKLWNALRMYITRKKGKWEYVAFVEGQKHRRNMPHFHIIMSLEPPDCRGKRGLVTDHAVHAFAVRRGFGFEAKLETVTSHRAAHYVSKYASKGTDITPKGFRHVRASRGWTRPPKKLPYLVPAKGEDIAHFLLRVHDITGTPGETLAERWLKVQSDFADLSK